MTAPALPVTYNILLRRTGTAHYAKAGRKVFETAPLPAAKIDIDCDGSVVRGLVAHVYTPPGCDEHCIGTLFAREA